MTFKELLKKDFVIMDGGFGTMLQRRGIKPGQSPDLLNITQPELVKGIISDYVASGSDIVTACTFSSNRYKLSDSGYTPEQVICAAVDVARKATAGTDVLVAVDVGPIGQLLEPSGTLSFEEAYDIYTETAIAAEKSGADVAIIETQTDIYEVKAAVLAFREHSTLPLIVSMSFEKNGRTFTGCPVSAMVLVLEGLGVDALGINCSLGPNLLGGIVDELLSLTKLPIITMPNAGLPDPITGLYDLTVAQFTDCLADFAAKGVKFLGGCCGTTPEHITAIKERVQGITPAAREVKRTAAVCSGSSTVIINQPRIIGERINPTGKKLFKEALRNGDIDYILSQAIEQVHAGADILDVNVGLPEIDEKAMMVRAVKTIQGVTDTPLQLDSTIPEVLEAGLRAYNGKAIVNSVNGEEKSLSTVLPLVKKYGAAVVGLTLDNNGIPPKAEQRFEIAQRILARALELGIPREDVFIDCLTLTASAEQAAVTETLKAVKMVTEQLGLKTVLGVSNISFGLPNRELVNSTFLSMALTNGLTLPIINPNIAAMTGVVRAYKLLQNIDKNSTEFIAAYNSAAPKATAAASAEITIPYAIENGLKAEAAKLTAELLKTTDSMEIINGQLIPALDKIGSEFEKGKIFLPQLILSAEVSKACFDVIKAELTKTNGSSVSKGKVVLATVKGDIHDIGKNIVKVLLENYGYTVIDLGKDVPEQAVVDAAIENKVMLVGLSALMTTTLKSMENTVKLLRESGVGCKVVVGGAVLTPEYAESIGADFYARDAKETVDIAKKIYG